MVPQVLVIDDEPKIVSFIARALQLHGFAVDGVSDPARGLALARTGGFGLVVLDLRMPGMGGLQVLRETMRSRPEQQVIVLSALSDVETKVRCLDLGAVDYVTKPFSLTELLARIRSRLHHQPDRYLERRGLALDLKRRVAQREGRAVPLSAREFLLLEHLMRETDVSTREELLADVWGFQHDPGTNVVDVCVGRLRSKLGNDVIETVRNVGYRFCDP